MAKLDKAKEHIGFLKVLFTVSIAIDSSLIAWVFNNPHLTLKSFLVICIVVIFFIAIVFLFRDIIKKIFDLEEIS